MAAAALAATYSSVCQAQPYIYYQKLEQKGRKNKTQNILNL
jgi:hypothetical protein